MAPRLPDDSVLGGLPSANSQRPIASFDTTAPGKAMEQMGQGIANLGKGIGQGIQAYADRQDKQAILDESTIDSQRTIERLNFMSRAENAKDTAEIDTILKEREPVDDRYLSQYPDATRRQAAKNRYDVETAKDRVAINNRHKSLYEEATIGKANNDIEVMRRNALEINTPDSRQAAIDGANKRIDELVAAGIRTHEQGVVLKRDWAENFAISSHKLIPPEQRIAALGGIKEALRVKESSGDPRIVNKYGYAGFFQFGAPRLQTMGVYTPGANEGMATWSDQSNAGLLKNRPDKWTGTFNIPGFPQVKTMKDFLDNKDAQEAAYSIHDGLMEKEIRSRGLDAYIGQTIGGVRITADGLKAMVHLGGAGGAKRALDSGGRDQTPDGNGATVLQYAKLGETSRSPLSAAISPERRAQLIQESTREVAQQRSQLANERVAQNAARVNDLEVGAHDGRYTLAHVQAGRDEGWLNDFDQIKKVEKIIEERENKDTAFRIFMGKVERGEPMNAMDADDKKGAEEAVKRLSDGSNGKMTKAEAAKIVFEASGGTYLPKSGAAAIRGELISNEPERFMGAANIAANMLERNPNVFAGVEGGSELQAVGLKYAHFTSQNMSATAAAQQIMLENTEKYKTDIKNRIKDGELDKAEKELRTSAISELQNASFVGSGFFFDNDVGAPKQRKAIGDEWVEIAMRQYEKSGDLGEAKRWATFEMSKMWGVSNGKLTKFPPERIYPRDANGSHDYIYKQAAADIEAQTGHKVDPKSIKLDVVGGMTTAEQFRNGRPTSYSLWYVREQDGHKFVELLPMPRGQGFKPSPEAAEAALKAEAKAKFDAPKPPPIPQVTPDQMPPRAWNPGRPTRSQEDMKKLADDQNAATAARAKTLADQEAMRKNLSKTTEQETKDAVEGGSTLKNFIDSTPKNPFKGYGIQLRPPREKK